MTTLFRSLALSLAAAAIAAPALADDYEGPPFDFADSFYLQNGINPATLIGRPTGSGPNSVMDNRDNGPDYNNIRILQQAAAYDHSGHPIFFYVTGLPTAASFLDNAAGREAREIAEEYDVYEFPRIGSGEFSAFPKRQDLIADLRHGYFSNNPLGIWRIKIVRFTDAALNTPAGQSALNSLAHRNGRDLDGTPIIRTISEIEDLQDDGYVSITIPPANGGPGVFRWFFCPVIEDPRDGAIAPDAHLDVTGEGVLPAAEEFVDLFHCLQTTGDDDCPGMSHGGGRRGSSDCDQDGAVTVTDIFSYLGLWFAGHTDADFDFSGTLDVPDIFSFLGAWFAGR